MILDGNLMGDRGGAAVRKHIQVPMIKDHARARTLFHKNPMIWERNTLKAIALEY